MLVFVQMIQADRIAAEKSGQAINLKQAATSEPLPPHKPQMRVSGLFLHLLAECKISTPIVAIFCYQFKYPLMKN